jgi:hypothetical protein
VRRGLELHHVALLAEHGLAHLDLREITHRRADQRSGVGSEHVPDVVERGGGADVTAQDGEVLVTGDVGDLALLDAGGRRGGGVARAQRVARQQRRGKPGVRGAAFDDQRDRFRTGMDVDELTTAPLSVARSFGGWGSSAWLRTRRLMLTTGGILAGGSASLGRFWRWS